MVFNILKQIEEARKKLGRDPLPIELPIHDSCSCNKCPIDSNYKKMEVAEGDVQRRCSLPKRIRRIIGEHYHLENRGLYERELLGEKRWESMPENERKAKQDKLREISFLNRLNSKGYSLTRKKKDTPVLVNQNGINPKNDRAGTPTSQEIQLLLDTPFSEVGK